MTALSATHRARPHSRAKEVTTVPVLVFAIVVILWLAFAAMLLTSEPSIHEFWGNVSGLPVPLKAAAWIVFFPWMAAAATWETSSPLVIRSVIAAGLAWASIYAFYPWRQR